MACYDRTLQLRKKTRKTICNKRSTCIQWTAGKIGVDGSPKRKRQLMRLHVGESESGKSIHRTLDAEDE